MARLSSAIRTQVRQRAKARCEYCGLPEGLSKFDHQVDHIVPDRHGGTDENVNLAWACFRCNNSKGTDIGTIDFETGQRVWLFDPRNDIWEEHFEIDADGEIVGRTVIGRATARLLMMNASPLSRLRITLIEAGLW